MVLGRNWPVRSPIDRKWSNYAGPSGVNSGPNLADMAASRPNFGHFWDHLRTTWLSSGQLWCISGQLLSNASQIRPKLAGFGANLPLPAPCLWPRPPMRRTCRASRRGTARAPRRAASRTAPTRRPDRRTLTRARANPAACFFCVHCTCSSLPHLLSLLLLFSFSVFSPLCFWSLPLLFSMSFGVSHSV